MVGRRSIMVTGALRRPAVGGAPGQFVTFQDIPMTVYNTLRADVGAIRAPDRPFGRLGH